MPINQKYTGQNLGGVAYLYLFLVDNVVDDDVANFSASAKTDIVFVDQTAFFSEKEKLEDDGRLYDKRLEFTVAKDRPDLLGFLSDNANKRFMFLIQNQNGDTLLAGSKDYPFVREYNRQTGDKLSDRNQVQLNFFCKSTEPSYFYTLSETISANSALSLSLSNSYDYTHNLSINWVNISGFNSDKISIKIKNNTTLTEVSYTDIANRGDLSYTFLDLRTLIGITAGQDVTVSIAVRKFGVLGAYTSVVVSNPAITNISATANVYSNKISLSWANNANNLTAFDSDIVFAKLVNTTTSTTYYIMASASAIYRQNLLKVLIAAIGTAGQNYTITYRMQNIAGTATSTDSTLSGTIGTAVNFSSTPATGGKLSFDSINLTRTITLVSTNPWTLTVGAPNAEITASTTSGGGNATITITGDLSKMLRKVTYPVIITNNIGEIIQISCNVTEDLLSLSKSEVLFDYDGAIPDTDNQFSVISNTAWETFNNPSTNIYFIVGNYSDFGTKLIELTDDSGFSFFPVQFLFRDTETKLITTSLTVLAQIQNISAVLFGTYADRICVGWSDVLSASNYPLQGGNDYVIFSVKNNTTLVITTFGTSFNFLRSAKECTLSGTTFGTVGQTLDITYYTQNATGKSKTATITKTIKDYDYWVNGADNFSIGADTIIFNIFA